MKNLCKILLIVFLFVPTIVFGADRYWVGGSGNWSDDDNHWATSSGGAPADGNLPTSSDNCFFDSSSHTTNYTVTQDITGDCLNVTITAPAAGNMTWSGGSAVNVYGSWSNYSGFINNRSGNTNFVATATGKTITTNGKAFAGNVIFNGVGGEWTLSDNLSASTNNTNLTNGSLIINDKTLTAGNWTDSGTATRALTLTTGGITVSNNFNGATLTNYTWTQGTSNITLTGNGALEGGGRTFATTTFTGVSTANGPTIVDSNTFVNLVRTNTSGYTDFYLSANQTVTGTFTVTGNNANSERIIVRSDTMSTARTITAAAVSLTNVDFRDITGAGAATWTGTSIGDAGGNTNITVTTPTTRYWDDDGGAWTDTAQWSASSGGGGGASMPLPQDDVVFDGNSFTAGSQTVTIGTAGLRLGKNITWTGVTNTPTWSINAISGMYGSLTLVSGMSMSGTSAFSLFGRGTHTITMAGLSFGSGITQDGPGGTYTLQDAFTTSSTFNLTRGHYDANDFNHTSTTFASSNANTRTLSMGSGTFTLTGTGTLWNMANITNLTLNQETSTIKLTNASATTKTFSGGGETYYNYWATGSGTGTFNFVGSNTFNDIKVDTPPHTILFTAGTTQTVTTFTVSGTSGNLMTIGSITASGHTLTKAGGGTICVDYWSISRSTATPGTTWYASNSTDGGNNSGWTFGACPGAGGGAVQVDSGVIFFE